MAQKFIFLIGLPGSGKSTWLEDNSEGFEVVSADKIKIESWIKANTTPPYMSLDIDRFNEEFHERSVELAEEDVYKQIEAGKDVILDGGGINRSYNLRIIDEVKELNPNIEIKGVYFNVPIEVCIKRIESRDRKVPLDDIYKKNQLLPAMLNRYESKGIEIETVNYFTDKYIFFDMDGTLCSLNNVILDINGNVDYVNTEFFSNSRRIETSYQYLVKCWQQKKELFILTACPNSIACSDKLKWIKSNLGPGIKDENIMWVGNKDYKHVFLQQYLMGKKIDPKDVLYIDDTMEILNKMKTIGINTKHVSQL